MLAGTDNDYSVTQNGSPVQLDVYFKPLGGGAMSRIQCTIATPVNCRQLHSQPLTTQKEELDESSTLYFFVR